VFRIPELILTFYEPTTIEVDVSSHIISKRDSDDGIEMTPLEVQTQQP
jgi:hypothetical protein